MGEPITISGVRYQVGKLDAFRQLHVGRRVMPIMGALIGLMKADVDIDLNLALPAVAEQLAAMPDADIDYIVKTCLSVVNRETAAGWAPVLASSGSLMFQDIDMMQMLQIVGASIKENLAGFFDVNALTSNQVEAPQA